MVQEAAGYRGKGRSFQDGFKGEIRGKILQKAIKKASIENQAIVCCKKRLIQWLKTGLRADGYYKTCRGYFRASFINTKGFFTLTFFIRKVPIWERALKKQ